MMENGRFPVHQARLPYKELLEISGILLEHGAEITDRAREFLLKSAEHFQRVKRGIEDMEFLRCQTENLEKLYQIFDVKRQSKTRISPPDLCHPAKVLRFSPPAQYPRLLADFQDGDTPGIYGAFLG